MAKRAQLSVETMIMYGLILLVALSVIGVLLYFNVIDLGSYLPSTCDLGGSGDLKCEEYQYIVGGATGAEIKLGIRNIGQKPIDYLNVSVTDAEGVHFFVMENATSALYGTKAVSDTQSLPAGGIAGVTIVVHTGVPGQVFRGTLKTTYSYKNGGINNTASGSMRLKVPE